MSLPSLYGSGDDEAELFRLTRPDGHPNADDPVAAKLEQKHIANSDYQDRQEEFDEQAEPLAELVEQDAWQSLTEGEQEAVVDFIRELQGRRRCGGNP